MTKETRHVIEHKRFPWSFDDIIVPVIELIVFYFVGSNGYDGIMDGPLLIDKLDGAFFFLLSVAGIGLCLLRITQINSFIVIETPLDAEGNFLFCLDRVKAFHVIERDFDKWNYSVGIRAQEGFSLNSFWLTMICHENKVFINERPQFLILSLWWSRNGLNRMKAEVSQLQKGKEFAEAELNAIQQRLADHANARAAGDTSLSEDPWEKNLVHDPNAPALYTPGAIYAFSFFLTALAGAILLSFNTRKSNEKLTVIGVGILYTAFTVYILSFLPRNLVITVWINTLGAKLITSLFWDKYVGRQTKFRAKPVWIPVIIAVIVAVVLLMYSFR